MMAKRWHRPSGLAWMLLAGTVAGCATQTPEREVVFTLSDWSFRDQAGSLIETGHYRIHTTVRDTALLAQFPVLMESARAQYEALVPPALPVSGKTDTYLFADRADWLAFTMQTFPPNRAVQLRKIRWGGYSEAGIAVIEFVSNAATYPVLVHEGLHQYLHTQVQPGIPAWLNEGLAVCAEGMRWTGPTAVTFDVWDNPRRRNQLAKLLLRDELIPLQELLRTHAGRVIDGAPSRVQAYYAQVWALCLFLMDENEPYTARFRALRDDLGNPELERRARAHFVGQAAGDYNYGESLFRAMINDDLEIFEDEYVRYMRRQFLNDIYAVAR